MSSALFEADDPIDDDRAVALAVNDVLRGPLSEFLTDQRTKLRWSVGAGAGAVVLGLVALLSNLGGLVSGLLVVLGIAAGGGGYVYFTGREPDVTVTGVEKGYWTGHCIPDAEGVVVYDATGSLESTSFDLERLSDESAVEAANERLAEFEQFPVVMPSGENVEETFTETLEAVRAEIEGAERRTVEAPVVPADGPEANAVSFFAARADEGAEPVSTDVAIPDDEAREDVEQLADLERMAAEAEGEAELEELSATSRQLVGDLSSMQEMAIDLMNDHVATAADAFGLVSYHFYCPDCQVDDIDSRVTFSDPVDGEWYCDTCRSHHDTTDVIPRHRLKDDVVNPVWDQLWIEKDDQRREIYENIEDQKQELEEREFEQRREEIRSATDRIRDLRQRIRDLKTEAKAAEGKVDEIGDLMVKYERLNEERKQRFQQDVTESFAEIDERTQRILQETRNEEQQRIDEAQKAAKEKAETIREEERRREVEKFMAEQQLENARTRAEVAHEDAQTGAEMEQRAELHDEEISMEKRHHRENWMLKTRGKTSISDRIDRGKMWKDRVWHQSVHGGDS